MTTPADTAPEDSNVRFLPGEGHGRLTTLEGEPVPVRAYKHGDDLLLVTLLAGDDDAVGAEEPVELEYSSVRGVVRLHGSAVLQEPGLIRFHAEGDPEVDQRRSFVRVRTPQRVVVDTGPAHEQRAHTVDLSGGGMLLAGANGLLPGQKLSFQVEIDAEQPPVCGVARVVRTRGQRQCAVVFEQIDEHDRQRLVRFIFECMRAARAKTRGDWM